MKKMKLYFALIILFISQTAYSSVVTVYSTKGRVEVRRGVSDIWKTLLVGDLLKPEDTIRTGEKAEVKLQISQNESFTLSEFSMIDIADIRQVTKNDLLLKLAMEYIRLIPNSKPSNSNPSMTTMHGENKSLTDKTPSQAQKEIAGEISIMRFEGAKALYRQKYFSSAILAVKSTARKFGLRDAFDAHKLVAQAFERLGLIQQAIDEYVLCSETQLIESQQKEVDQQLSRLKELTAR